MGHANQLKHHNVLLTKRALLDRIAEDWNMPIAELRRTFRGQIRFHYSTMCEFNHIEGHVWAVLFVGATGGLDVYEGDIATQRVEKKCLV